MAAMNAETQRQFMYLFERIGEPLYLSPRGGTNNIIFDIPVDNLSEQDRDAMLVLRRMYDSGGSSQQNRIAIDRSVRAPDLSNVGKLCPRNTIFSYFITNHRRAVNELTRTLLEQQDRNKFLALAAVCRDDTRINCQLWLNAVASCCIRRADMRGFRLPALYEISPGSFFDPHTLRQAREQGARPEQDRAVVVVEQVFTGRENNEDTRLAYFREDVGINSHHWHWHLIYNSEAPRTGQGSRNRKGELFYYMHHSMMARYNAERLCNRMALATPLVLDQPLREGYFPKLTDANSGRIWGTRQERTNLSNVERPDEDLRVQLDELRKWGDRISEAIDAGVIMNENNQRIQLTEENGIDILGDIVENGGTVAPNPRFYGNYHNMGHVAIAFSHDPVHRHREAVGVMGDTVGAMRDPIFYRWHQHIDEVFDKYKQTLPPYTQQQLVWQPVQVNAIEIQTQGRDKNTLYTYWMQRDVDLARGLDFTRDSARNGPIFARITHLQHDAFQYNITINNTSNQAVQGTVRIFMAPRNNQNGQRFDFRQQRLLFFELDKFTVNLQRGRNVLTRNSTDSSVTIPWAQTFRDLEGLPAENDQITGQQAVCGCGWPQHMLIPRGSANGIVFDVFVIVTNAADDVVPRRSQVTEAQRQGCKDAVSFCGILDELYPDKKPMGFPFDRRANNPGTSRPLESLDAFIPQNSNMATVQVRIIHQAERIEVAPGGAPPDRNLINSVGEIRRQPQNAVARPSGNRGNTNSQSRPSASTNTQNRPSGNTNSQNRPSSGNTSVNNQTRPNGSANSNQGRPSSNSNQGGPTGNFNQNWGTATNNQARPTGNVNQGRPNGNFTQGRPTNNDGSRSPSPAWGVNGIGVGRPNQFSPSPPPGSPGRGSPQNGGGWSSPNRGWGSRDNSPSPTPDFTWVG